MSGSNEINGYSNNFSLKNHKKKKFQIWPQNFEGKREDIYNMCANHENRVKRMTAVLNEEEKVNGSNKNYLEFNKGVIEKNKGRISILPEKVQNNIAETRRLNEDLKKKVEEIAKMNSLYVIKHGSKYINVKNETEDNLMNQNNNQNILPKITKKEAPKNFRYINDSYRTQLMRAFLNFNPAIHLNNLRNLLEKADPAIKEDINNLWETIEKDLKEVLDPHYYRKKYNRMVEENNRRNLQNTSSDNDISSYRDDKNSSRLKLPKVKANFQTEKKKTIKKVNKVSYEFEPIKDFISYINRILSDKRIETFVDKAKSEPPATLEKNMNLHFREMKLAEDVLKTLQSNKINKNTESELKEIKTSVTSQNEDIIKTIAVIRASLIKDILEKK